MCKNSTRLENKQADKVVRKQNKTLGSKHIIKNHLKDKLMHLKTKEHATVITDRDMQRMLGSQLLYYM